VPNHVSLLGGVFLFRRGFDQYFNLRPTRLRPGDDAYDKYPDVIQQIVETTALGRLGEANDVGAFAHQQRRSILLIPGIEPLQLTGANLQLAERDHPPPETSPYR
jgi:hypothetical protein